MTTPPGYHTITPRMVVADPDAAVAFLREVFDADSEATRGRPAEVRIGDSRILISGTGEREAFPAFLYVYVPDTDATYARALAAGAVSIEAPQDTPYGDYRAMIRDPHGNTFQIATRKG